MNELDKHLDPSLSYVGEFCSPWNKIVRTYNVPQVYLLTAFQSLTELTHDECDAVAKDAHMLVRPERHNFTSMDQVQEYLTHMSETDPTYEGVVIRDVNNHHWKIKSPTYLSLHRMGSVKENLFNPKYLIPFIMTGETDELLTYFKEVKPALDHYTEQVNGLREQVLELWWRAKDVADQKFFALMVKDHPLSSVLFTARKANEDPEKVFRSNTDLILKKITQFHERIS